MNTIQIDDALRAKLNGMTENVVVYDETGKTVGYFVPDALFKKLVYAWMDSQVTDEELAAADAALDECLVSLGHPLGADNEQIDADLAREYGDDHAGLYGPLESK